MTATHPAAHVTAAGQTLVRVDRAAGVNRRQALGAMAASLALANTACSPPPKQQAVPYVHLPDAGAGGLPLYYASAFVREGHAQGVLVGTQEGRPVKIEGNPRHPSSLGATDIWAQASVLQLWDPDRSTAVRQRLPQTSSGPARTALSSWAAFEASWRARSRGRTRAGRPATLHVLTGPLSSPTERALLAALLEREPAARWHVHAPLADVAFETACRGVYGRAVAPVYHFERARCVLALAADPFTDGPGATRHAMDWASARRAVNDAGGHTGASAALPTLLAAECVPGLFGARADHRIALSPARIEELLWRVSTPWFPELKHPTGVTSQAEADFEARVVAALQAAGPQALVIGGPGLSKAAHALILALNERLGTVGHGLEWIASPVASDGAGDLPELVAALNAGMVDTLLVLGANPAYDAPAGWDVARALERAPLLVHAGLYADETASLAHWHLPLSHGYEQWSDALAHDGTATLLQPAIARLYDTRSTTELLALLGDDPVQEGHDLVQRQWQRERQPAEFDAFWRESVRTGVVAGSAFTALALAPAPFAPAQPVEGAPLAALFVADAAVRDGSFANNGWLQELPRPLTKLTWDNALQLGPATAARLGVHTGDVVRAEVGSASVEAPVWVESTQAEDVVVLPLGGGRRRAGRVGTGVGFDANRLRASDAATAAVRLTSVARQHVFAFTQHELDQHDRALARTVAAGATLARPADRPSLYPPFPSPVHAWAMTIDLDTCIGCNACTIACQSENNIPVVGREQVAAGRAMHWIRVDRYAAPEIAGTIFQPVPCMHCEEAPCEVVCPVGATVHDSEGLNVQVYNRCIGTRFCSNNCPYKVRRFNFLQYADQTTETLKAQRNPEVTVRQRGVMEKCSYCVQRVATARQHAQRDGVALVDGDVVTACQSACPTRAIRYGDLNDPASDIVQAKASPRHYAMLEELNTRPRTTYLARIRPES